MTGSPRVYQCLFLTGLLPLCWLGMMAVHEAGHVCGALLTGGSIDRVVLSPLTISRTELSVNPHPLIVVWAGPLCGVLLPVTLLVVLHLIRRRPSGVIQFFVGFCLIANGAYISGGSFGHIGDCGVMLRHGSPAWLLYLFGAVTVPTGFWLWHRLGSLREFVQDPSRVSPRMAHVSAVLCVAVLVLLVLLQPA